MIQPAKIQVRFRDCDMMGHVNNAVYLSYFEETRIHYFSYIFGNDRDWRKNGVVLRKNEIEYIKPVLLKDTPEIHMFTEHIGTKSFTLAYELVVNQEVYTTGKSVLVCFDSTQNQTYALTEEMKMALETLKKK